MLKSAQINGFKNLNNFNLELNPGLNVLVGPNGAGKTNIFRAFELFSYLTVDTLERAISRMGEIISVFDVRKKQNVIDFHICGECLVGNDVPNNSIIYSNGIEKVAYSIKLSISLDERNTNPIRYTFQEVQISLKSRENKPFGNVKLTYSEGNESVAKVDEYITENFKDFSEKISEILSLNQKAITRIYLLNICEEYFFDDNFDLIVQCVNRDVQIGKPYDINPVMIRSKESIGREPGINFDGSGLLSTLYHLRPNSSTVGDRVENFRHIVDHLELACPELNDLVLGNPDVDKNIVIHAKFHANSKEEFNLPISYLSDGTLKWLALVTAVVIGESVFTIEEPEKYMHTNILDEFIRLLKQKLEEDSQTGQKFALISTHSESLIDILSAQELILTDFSDGHTRARRIKKR